MNPIIDRIAIKIKDNIKKLDYVEGIVYFGSYARNIHDFYSDLDVFIYLNDSLNAGEKDEVKKNIIEIFQNDEEGISNEFEIYDKWIIFTERSFIKIEIGIKSITEAKNDSIFIVESRIPHPGRAIVYDKNNKIKQIYTENWVDLSDYTRLKDLFIEEIYKFIYYFRGFLIFLAKDDEYKAYMNFTIAFYKLAGLKAMVKGEYYNLYQPSRFTTNIIDDWNLRVKYYRASAGLRKYDMLDQRDNFKSLFLDVLKKGIQKFNLNTEILSEFEKFFSKADDKYLPFKNFRDISLLVNKFSNGVKIKNNLIYRGASLSKNDSELILRFLKERRVKWILDLRGINELNNYIRYNNFYDENLKENYVINIPIEPVVEIYVPDKPAENFYYAFLREFRPEIKIILEKYFANASSNRLIIHCEGGKDRTGIIIAIVLDLLGVERYLIIEDYLLSYSDTKRDYIEFLLKTIDTEYAGIENFLMNYCNISKESIRTIKEVLIEKL